MEIIVCAQIILLFVAFDIGVMTYKRVSNQRVNSKYRK